MDFVHDFLPPELWRMILSLLPFEEQTNCRSVCKDWMDLITNLPGFKSKNYLNLEFCTLAANEPPLTDLQYSVLKFTALKATNETSVEISPFLSTFLSQLGETVTCLDLSCINSDEPRKLCFFFENLNLFKVLHHLSISSIEDWLDVVYKEWSHYDSVLHVINLLLIEHEAKMLTKDSVRTFFENESLEEFLEHSILEGCRQLVIAEIFKYIGTLNRADPQERFEELSEPIAEQICSKIRTKRARLDLSNSCNARVRVLSMKCIGNRTGKIVQLEGVYELLPNVQELHVTDYDPMDSLSLKFLNLFSSKISTFSVCDSDLHQLQLFNLPILKHLKLKTFGSFLNNEIDQHIKKFPNLNSISFNGMHMPRKNHHYFTELIIEYPSVSFIAFKNLTSLEMMLHPSHPNVYCFRSHQRFSLDSVKSLKLDVSESLFGLSTCSDCFDNLLQSVPNLSKMIYINLSASARNSINSIFRLKPNLKELFIDGSGSFQPNAEWPVMKYLRKLKICFALMSGSKEDWDQFGKKLNNLRYLGLFGDNEYSRLEVKDVLGYNMPLLQRAVFADTSRNENDTETVITYRNGKKLNIQFRRYNYDSGDDIESI